MNPPLGGLDTATFLREYWQKKPLLIRRAMPGFEPELDIDDIAGLACEELAESRLVTGSFPAHDWTVQYGPFDERALSGLPDSDWTLLVQDVEKHYPPLKPLLTAFDFLPRWRLDDLMVSVAAKGGSVGPHTDQYDVFLLQAKGRRKWQIAENFAPQLLEGCELNVLKSFEPEQEWTLEPGDMLYLPPGIAHHGIALETCMTWSAGMRAPSCADLFQALGEWLAENHAEGSRYGDPDLQDGRPGAEIDAASIQRMRELAVGAVQDESVFADFLGMFLSRYRMAHEPAPPTQTIEIAGLTDALNRGFRLRHNPWTRLFWINSADGAALFAAGTRYSCSAETASLVCEDELLKDRSGDLAATDPELMCRLVNDGHLYLEDAK